MTWHETENGGHVVHSPTLPYISIIPNGLCAGATIRMKGHVRADGASKSVVFDFDLVAGSFRLSKHSFCKLKQSRKPRRFSVNLAAGLCVNGSSRDDHALCFSVDLESNEITVNSLVDNRCTLDQCVHNVFLVGQAFTMKIHVGQDGFKIAVNDKHLTDYTHRIKVDVIQTIYVNGCIQLDLIEIENR